MLCVCDSDMDLPPPSTAGNEDLLSHGWGEPQATLEDACRPAQPTSSPSTGTHWLFCLEIMLRTSHLCFSYSF